MNKIPLSLWKEIVQIPKNRTLWQRCKDLGKDPGPEDPSWPHQVPTRDERSHGFFFHETYSLYQQGLPEKDMIFSVSWGKETELVYQATVTFYHGNQACFMIGFRDIDIKVVESGPEILRKMAMSPRVFVTYSKGGSHAREQYQGHARLEGFQPEELEKIIRVYQACSPVTLWLVEDMARFLHEQANLEAIVNPSIPNKS